MDIKIDGVTREIMAQALEQAAPGPAAHPRARWPRRSRRRAPSICAYAPRILTIHIPKDKIRDIIGPGGKTIRSIVEQTGCKIDVEDDGRVYIASTDEAAARRPSRSSRSSPPTAEIGKIYLGKVMRVVELRRLRRDPAGHRGPAAHLASWPTTASQDVRDVVKEGDEVMVKVIDIDPAGKIRLSRKALIEAPEERVAAEVEGGWASRPWPPEAAMVAAAASTGLTGIAVRVGGAIAALATEVPRGTDERSQASAGGQSEAQNRGMRPRLPLRALLALVLFAAPASAQEGEVVATKAGFKPKVLKLRKGDTTHLVLKSGDGEEHCFAVDELRIEKRIRAGKADTPRRDARARGELRLLLIVCAPESEALRGKLVVAE